MIRKKSKKKSSYLPNHRWKVQWNYKLSNFGKLKWRNHEYFRTKKDAQKELKKQGGHNPQGIYRHRIRKRW